MVERSNRSPQRILARLGLHHVAHRPPLVWRFWVYAGIAYLLPVVAQVLSFPNAVLLGELVWLIMLVPAFLLALHFGLRGAFVALLVGISLLVSVQLSLTLLGGTPGDPRYTVSILIAYGALAICVGWLSEELHEHYAYALELQAMQKTEALGTMAAGIAHDFNNILTAMVTNAELLASEQDGAGEGAVSELEELRASARRGSGIVRNLLGFSRRSMLRLRPVDLPRAVSELEDRIRDLVPDRIDVRVNVEPDLPLAIADRDSLEPILMNLVGNARDGMAGTGILEIYLRKCRLGVEHRIRKGWGEPGDYVCLEVRDNGSGMDEETAARIFEPFFSRKDPGEGVGLGMAMVYGLMKQHRGFVDVESAPGEGTVVRTYFPVAKEPVWVPVDAGAIERREAGSTILMVEDDLAILRAARRVLERAGYSIRTAVDGQDALRVYEESHEEIDLILSDVMLPKLSGPELYETIRAKGHHPRILFMSGYPAHTVRDQTGLDPNLPFLQKPWTVDELIRAVQDALGTEPAAISD